MASSTPYKDTGHAVIPDVPLNGTKSRKLRVITIGAGICGIINAYNIQKSCNNVEHVIYEKNADIGGVWFENTYPGCACDIPSHAYTLRFAPNVRLLHLQRIIRVKLIICSLPGHAFFLLVLTSGTTLTKSVEYSSFVGS
jgi:hypothetical protein